MNSFDLEDKMGSLPQVVAFVPIKLHSERIPNKNQQLLDGKPLYTHILNTLTESAQLGAIYVYCSDVGIANDLPAGVLFCQRDKSLDGTRVRGREIWQAFAEAVPALNYVLAHTTSPFTRSASVDEAIAAIKSPHYDSAFTAQVIRAYVWKDGKPLNFSPHDIERTQDLDSIVIENSGVYGFSRHLLMSTGRRIGARPKVIPVSFPETIDIDELVDLDLARSVIPLASRGEFR